MHFTKEDRYIRRRLRQASGGWGYELVERIGKQ